jgi:hypothetical protein
MGLMDAKVDWQPYSITITGGLFEGLGGWVGSKMALTISQCGGYGPLGGQGGAAALLHHHHRWAGWKPYSITGLFGGKGRHNRHLALQQAIPSPCAWASTPPTSQPRHSTRNCYYGITHPCHASLVRRPSQLPAPCHGSITAAASLAGMHPESCSNLSPAAPPLRCCRPAPRPAQGHRPQLQ